MPYTLKKNKFKYKNPDTGNYEGVDVVAERSFADYQSALENVGLQQQTVVRSEGTTQKNAVTAAGTAAVANFPATAAACDTLAGDFAATYVPDQAYAVGDYCTYQYQLYQCKTAIAVNTDHTFVTSHWNLITVTDTINDQVGELKTQLNEQIIISETQPVSENNKIWIDSDADSVQVPTMTELELIKKAALIRKSASGSIANFSDGADGLEIRSITLDNGATTLSKRGKNLFDKTDSNQLIAQSYIGTGAIVYSSDRACVTIPCKPNTTYTVSRKRLVSPERLQIAYAKTTVKPKVGDSIYGLVWAEPSGTVGDTFSVTITTGDDATYIVVWAYWQNATSALNDLQIELGSNATDYAAFEGEDYTVNNGEPTEQVTTLYGMNVFWADVGNVAIGYYADTTLALEALQQ